MTDHSPKDEAPASSDALRARLLEAACAHVAFDGWSETTFKAAVRDTGMAEGLARALFPRPAIDLALAYHHAGDREMVARLTEIDDPALSMRRRIEQAVMLRLELADRELVRRGTVLMALPQYAGEGARALWGTADAIWTALGVSDQDASWYTRRATLSAVHGATVLFWLGDDSAEHGDTRAFLQRRLEGVVRFEKLKAGVQANPLGRLLMAGPNAIAAQLRAPRAASDLPGHEGSRPSPRMPRS